MNFECGLHNLDSALKQAGLTPYSDVYLDFVGWRRQLLESIEDERRFAGLDLQGRHRRERVLRELDRLALRYAGVSIVDLCIDVEPSASSLSHRPNLQIVPDNTTVKNTHALLIGIAAYRYIRPLAKTTTDAQDLYDVLLHYGYPSANVALLLDDQATKAAINDKLNWLASRVRPNDTVIIFFSGHGAQLVGGFWPGEYLCPVEATLDKVRDTFISDEEFTAALRAIHAGRLVVFLDACHAGGVGEPKVPTVQVKAGLSETAYDHFLAQGRVIIAACKPDEVSYELPEMRNGLFTHYLLEGLRGGAARPDGTIWMSNLFGYVYEHVSQHNLQHPFQKSEAEDFIIATTKQPTGLANVP